LLSQLLATLLSLRLTGDGSQVARNPRSYDRWQFRRRWFTVFGIVGIVMLLGSLVADAFLGTNITANVVDPVCIMLGVNLLGYIYGRNTEKNVDNDSLPPS